MAKRYKVVNPLQSGTSTEFLTDWNKCIFCQEDLSEKLHCPAESRRNTMGAGTRQLLTFLWISVGLVACLKRWICHVLMMVMELKLHLYSIKPSGMIHADLSIIKPEETN